MQFSVRTSNYEKNTMVNMCDAELIGTDVVDGELKIHISENYYGKELVDKDKAVSLLQSASKCFRILLILHAGCCKKYLV